MSLRDIIRSILSSFFPDSKEYRKHQPSESEGIPPTLLYPGIIGDVYRAFYHGTIRPIRIVVTGCRLRSIPENISVLESVDTIAFGQNSIEHIPAVVFTSRLKYLNLDINPLSTLPDNAGDASNLETLCMNFCQFTDIPDSVCDLWALNKLNFHHNFIRQVNERFGELVNLTILDLSENQIKDLPDSFNGLKSLECLNLSHNKFKKIPLCLFELPLQNLNLANNSITVVDTRISDITTLKRLDLSNNKIEIKDLPFSELLELDLQRIEFIGNIYNYGDTPVIPYDSQTLQKCIEHMQLQLPPK